MIVKKSAKRLAGEVPALCFGTSPLGSMPDTYGYSVDEETARDTIRAMLALDPVFIDTSRNYGMGRSEERIGAVVRELGGLPAGCVLATKVDRHFETNRFNSDRVRRSFEESLQALGVDRVDVLHLHDPEYCADLDEVTRSGGAIDELFKLKAEGLVGAVGLAMGKMTLMEDLLPRWDFDALISHNRFTLLNRQADRMFTEAHSRGIAIFNAAPYAGGVLAKGSSTTKRITYQDATEEQLAPVRAIEDICERHGVPLGAVALQFSMRDPRVTSTICGVSKSGRVRQTVEWANYAVPDEVWDEVATTPFSSEDPEANRDYTMN